MTEKEITKLKRAIYIWENIGVGMNSSTKEKEVATKQFLEKNSDYNFYQVCDVIGLNKGTYYHFINDKKSKTQYEIKDEKLSIEIKNIYDETEGRIGSNKIKIILDSRNVKASLQKVRKLMKKMNLKVVMKKPNRRGNNTTPKNIFRNNLLKKQFFQDKPNKVWVSDFTEIKINRARFYLCVILDLFSRKVVAYRLSIRLNSNLALLTFKDAYQNRGEPNDLLFHSDQGAQYTSIEFMNTLKALKIKQSFSNPGNPYDNAVMESFFATLKREEVHRKKYKDYENLKESISKYIVFYNNVRPHKSLNYLTPTKFEDNNS
ncbi:MAG: IS3 family transposase [Erysipelotrichaceae bacterium]|nr:IS3 family transposase [Erysipelotrichaceae bacterium]